MNASDLGGDPYINLMLSGFIEVPACIGSIFLMDRWGRRPTLSLAYFIAGVSCICMQAVKKGEGKKFDIINIELKRKNY